MQDKLNAMLNMRSVPHPRAGLEDDIIRHATMADQSQAKPVAFFMFRPRYAYAVVGLFIIGVIALLASYPQNTSSTPSAYDDISTYMVYDSLLDLSDIS